MPVEISRAIDAVARMQHGLVTSEQAVRALGPNRKDRWVREGRLISVQPRVFRLAGAPTTWHQALMAASLAADGIVSHRSAAELWGLMQPAGYLEVSVGHGHLPRLRPPAIAHRIRDLHPEPSKRREGLPLTDPVRTIIDLGLVIPRWGVKRALGRGISNRLLRIEEVERLRYALSRQGRDGTGIVAQILDEPLLLASEAESMLEARFRELVRRANLREPELQYEVWHAGRFVARIDAAYPDVKLAIEVDGYAHHSSPEAFQHDRTRQNQLVRLGWTVLRFTWHDVVHNAGAVAEAIVAQLERLSAAS